VLTGNLVAPSGPCTLLFIRLIDRPVLLPLLLAEYSREYSSSMGIVLVEVRIHLAVMLAKPVLPIPELMP